MPTNLYLLRLEPEYTPTVYRGTWNSNNGFVLSGMIFIDTNKYGNPTSLQAGDATITSTPWKHAHTCGVSRRLLPQTISGTVDIVIGVDQSGSGSMDYWKLHIYVVNETTGAVHGTLLDNYEETLANGGTEFAASTNTAKTLKAPATLTPVTIPSDTNKYRLVVEIGYITNRPAPSISSCRMRRGARTSDFVPYPDLVVGSITTQDEAGFIQFSGSLLFDLVLPPINREWDSAITITLPYEANIDPLHDYPTTLWYKCTPTIDTVLSILCCNVTDDMSLDLYKGVAPPFTSLTANYGSSVGLWPVKAGELLYFAIYADSYISGQTFRFSILLAPTDPIQVGDLIVSEDYGHGGQNIYDPTFTGLFPYTWFTDTGVIRYVTAKLPACELGCCLTNGKWGIIDHNGQRIFIYNMASGLTEVGRFALSDVHVRSMGTDFNFFYVVTDAGLSTSPGNVYKVTDAGVITGPIATNLVASGMGAAGSGGNASSGVSRDGSIFYYPNYVMGGLILRHNLITNVNLSAFPTPDATMVPGDVIVLSDGTIVAIFQSGTQSKLVHYSASGVILHNKDFESYPRELHHIAWEAHDNPDMVWCWENDNSLDLNRFRLYQFSTNSFIKEFVKPMFIGGYGSYPVDTSCNPTERWGAPDSCPLMIAMKVDSVLPPDLSGIYYINRNKTTGKHDSYYETRTPPGPTSDVEKKIPNPKIRSAYFGE